MPAGDEARLGCTAVARKTIGNQRRGLTVARGPPGAGSGSADRPIAPTPTSDAEPALEALARLSADQELLRLVAWEELSHAEIAEVMGISVNAVAIRLHRARARFEQALMKGPSRWRTWLSVKGSPSRRPSREEP